MQTAVANIGPRSLITNCCLPAVSQDNVVISVSPEDKSSNAIVHMRRINSKFAYSDLLKDGFFFFFVSGGLRTFAVFTLITPTPHLFIVKCLYMYNVYPLKPHFYIINWGLQGYTLFFLFLLKNIDCGYSLEPFQRVGSNEYKQSMF